jgi:RimJ/RimL family protein N-acetyltransferase
MKRAKVIGERIYLRPLEREDLDNGWHDWINDSTININLINPLPQNMDDMVKYYNSNQGSDCVLFAICDKSNDKYIGNARLSRINWINRTAEYGRMIGLSEYRGKGYGTDALIQLFRFGFHNIGLNRIWSTAWIENKVSLASNSKMGMVVEGTMRQAVFKNGKFHDTVILSMIREDFDKKYGDFNFLEK